MAFRLLLLNICALAFVVCRKYDIQLSSPKLRRFFSTYDKSTRPSVFNGGPVTVRIGMYYNTIEVIKEPGRRPKMDFTAYMRLNWEDPRFKALVKGGKPLTMEDGAWKYAWIPDLFSRSSEDTKVFREPIDHTLMRVNASGSVWYVYKVRDRIHCKDIGSTYTLQCRVINESFKYTMNDVVLAWLSSPVDIDKQLDIPDYSLQDVILYDCSQNYTAGAFPCLEQRFLLKKD